VQSAPRLPAANISRPQVLPVSAVQSAPRLPAANIIRPQVLPVFAVQSAPRLPAANIIRPQVLPGSAIPVRLPVTAANISRPLAPPRPRSPSPQPGPSGVQRSFQPPIRRQNMADSSDSDSFDDDLESSMFPSGNSDASRMVLVATSSQVNIQIKNLFTIYDPYTHQGLSNHSTLSPI
jgi:hypothetical protein